MSCWAAEKGASALASTSLPPSLSPVQRHDCVQAGARAPRVCHPRQPAVLHQGAVSMHAWSGVVDAPLTGPLFGTLAAAGRLISVFADVLLATALPPALAARPPPACLPPPPDHLQLHPLLRLLHAARHPAGRHPPQPRSSLQPGWVGMGSCVGHRGSSRPRSTACLNVPPSRLRSLPSHLDTPSPYCALLLTALRLGLPPLRPPSGSPLVAPVA